MREVRSIFSPTARIRDRGLGRTAEGGATRGFIRIHLKIPRNPGPSVSWPKPVFCEGFGLPL